MVIMRDWVIFDADNTLLNLETIYNETRDDFVDYMASIGFDPQKVEAYQRKRDAQLFEVMDYRSSRFPNSFMDTAEHFLKHPDPEVLRKALRIGESVFDRRPEMFDDAPDVINQLKGDFNVRVFTAGNFNRQLSRLRPLLAAADLPEEHVVAVSRKTPRTFARFIRRESLDPSRAWMVGDSLRSDIIPAREVGMNAIHVRHDNWREVEHAGLHLPDGAITADRLADVPDILRNVA